MINIQGLLFYLLFIFLNLKLYSSITKPYDNMINCTGLDYYLQALATTATSCLVMFMRRAVFLRPKWMAPILNQTIFICWNLKIYEIKSYNCKNNYGRKRRNKTWWLLLIQGTIMII